MTTPKAVLTRTEPAPVFDRADDDVATLQEVSRLFHVHYRTLLAWRKRHYGPPSFIAGNKLLYRVGSLRQWLRTQEQEQSGGAA